MRVCFVPDFAEYIYLTTLEIYSFSVTVSKSKQ